MTKQDSMNDSKPTSYMRIPMEPLYERLLKKPFSDSISAIEYCRSVCAEFGFTVKQEASANRNIYVYCSREGLPDSQRNPKPSPQRKRPSKRCDCRWRVVLSENEHEEWEFRKSMNPNASEHNHELMSPEEMIKAWPVEVNDMIIQLARQRLQTHEIREAVKQQFPDISWNERRFYNRLTEERKRIRQRGVVERSQRLLMLSARLCSVIASNEEWALVVESDLQRMFENFCQLARLTPENMNTLVDLEADMIQMETESNSNIGNTRRLAIIELEDEIMASPAKKRRSFVRPTSVVAQQQQQKGIQMVHVPSYTIQVRSPLSDSLVLNNNRRAMFNESSFLDNSGNQQAFGSSCSFFSLASPTSSSSSSSSSSMAFQQRQRNTMTQQRVISPPPPPPPQQQQQQQSNEFILSSHHSSYQTTQTQNDDNNNAAYNMQTSFSPYTIPTSAFTSPPELTPFNFDPITTTTSNAVAESSNAGFYSTTTKEESSQQHVLQRQQQEYEQRMHRTFSQQQGYSLPPMIRSDANNQDATTTTHWS